MDETFDLESENLEPSDLDATIAQGELAADSEAERVRREAEQARYETERRESEEKKRSDAVLHKEQKERADSTQHGVAAVGTVLGMIVWVLALHPWMILGEVGWVSYLFGPPLVLFAAQGFAAVLAGSHASERTQGLGAVGISCGFHIVGALIGVMLGFVMGIANNDPRVAGSFMSAFMNGVLLGYWGGVLCMTGVVLIGGSANLKNTTNQP